MTGNLPRPDDGLLSVDGLTKQFGGLTAVDGLSMSIGSSEIVGFIGPNGAGKTTTFNCVMGAYRPDKGTVRFAGKDVTGASTAHIVRSGLTRTFQNPRPVEGLTTVQNVAFAALGDDLLSFQRYSSDFRTTVVDICLEVGLAFEDFEKTPDELPHAGLIRLELARALAQDPDMVLVDETFAGLAAEEVSEFVSLFKDLQDQGLTFVIIDHNMTGLLELVDRVVVLHNGRKLAAGTPDEIQDDPDVRAAYLGGGEV